MFRRRHHDQPRTLRRTRGAARLAALFAAALAAGCAKPDVEKTRGAAPPAAPKVALVMKSLANEFFAAMADGARAHRDASGGRYELVVNGMRNETDVSEQVTLVEQMVARKVAAIVIAPADSKAVIPALKRAAEAGTVVVNIDNRLDPDVLREAGLTIPFVGPDNREGARKAGEAVAAKLATGAEVAIIEGIVTAFNGQQRALGLEDAAKAAGLSIVDRQSGQWEMEKAETIAAAMLTQHPGLAAILCANDSMALGAAAAVKAAGRTVLVSGFDDIPAVQPLLADGRITATVDQHGDRLAAEGIETALAILSGEAKPEDRTTPVDLVVAPAAP